MGSGNKQAPGASGQEQNNTVTPYRNNIWEYLFIASSAILLFALSWIAIANIRISLVLTGIITLVIFTLFQARRQCVAQLKKSNALLAQCINNHTAELESQATILQNEKALLRSILNSTPDPIFLRTKTGSTGAVTRPSKNTTGGKRAKSSITTILSFTLRQQPKDITGRTWLCWRPVNPSSLKNG